ncbi:MFS transporter, partial [Macrococcus hajekii]
MVFSTNYVIVLIVQLLTNLAFSFYTMGVTYFVYTTTHSVFYSSLITFLSLFSRILSGLSINIVSSLIKIKKLLIFTTFLQIIFTIIIFFLIHFESLILLYVFIALLSYTTGFFNPIKSLLLKKILDKEIMTKGLSIISSLDQTLSLLGWIAGGWLISIVGYKNIIIITIILITISLIVVSNLKIEDYKQILDSRNPFKALNTSMKN